MEWIHQCPHGRSSIVDFVEEHTLFNRTRSIDSRMIDGIDFPQSSIITSQMCQRGYPDHSLYSQAKSPFEESRDAITAHATGEAMHARGCTLCSAMRPFRASSSIVWCRFLAAEAQRFVEGVLKHSAPCALS
jgi:hypothetical protein